MFARAAAAADLKDLHFGRRSTTPSRSTTSRRWSGSIPDRQRYDVDEPKLDSLQQYIDHAEFSVGDFELYYRMHHRAGRAIRAVIEGDVDEAVRNEAAFRLARIHFQKGQPEDALETLQKIRGKAPEEIRDDVEFLRANVYMALGRPADAVGVLEGLQGSEDLKGFSEYNLAIALLEDGRPKEAVVQLDRAGQVQSRDPATLAIVDKSNLVLGTMLFEASAFEESERSLDRVRLRGPVLQPGTAPRGLGGCDRREVPPSAGSLEPLVRAGPRPMPPCRKRSWPCPTPTASWACTGARPFCTSRPRRTSRGSCASSMLRCGASTTAPS